MSGHKPRHGQKAYIQARIINRLRAAGGGWVSMAELIQHCYGTALFLAARASITAIICRMRKAGWPIGGGKQTKGLGYRYLIEGTP
jgi:hypothetical protein